MHKQGTPEYQLDHEIERTFRRLLRENQGFAELGRMAAMIGGNGGHDGHDEEPEICEFTSVCEFTSFSNLSSCS